MALGPHLDPVSTFPLPPRVDFNMEMDVVVDDIFAEEAEGFAGAVVAAEFGTFEREHCSSHACELSETTD